MTALILFIDNPEHARLEPALAAAIPAESATVIYDALLGRLRNLTTLFAGEKYLFYSHYPNWNDAWDINVFRKRIQLGESLPERLRAAIYDAREDAPGAIFWINTTAAPLDSAVIEQAVSLLEKKDLVIGADAAGSISFLGFGTQALHLEMPQDLTADAMASAAASAGLVTARIDVPLPPQSPEDLLRLGITLS